VRRLAGLALAALVSAVLRALDNRTPSAYDPICDLCDGDLRPDGFHWVHLHAGRRVANCPPCAGEARRLGLFVDPVRRFP
jgi:hypothetical protein